MADQRPAIRYTVLPADHPLVASLSKSHGSSQHHQLLQPQPAAASVVSSVSPNNKLAVRARGPAAPTPAAVLAANNAVVRIQSPQIKLLPTAGAGGGQPMAAAVGGKPVQVVGNVIQRVGGGGSAATAAVVPRKIVLNPGSVININAPNLVRVQGQKSVMSSGGQRIALSSAGQNGQIVQLQGGQVVQHGIKPAEGAAVRFVQANAGQLQQQHNQPKQAYHVYQTSQAASSQSAVAAVKTAALQPRIIDKPQQLVLSQPQLANPQQLQGVVQRQLAPTPANHIIRQVAVQQQLPTVNAKLPAVNAKLPQQPGAAAGQPRIFLSQGNKQKIRFVSADQSVTPDLASALGSGLHNQIVRTPDGQQFLIRRTPSTSTSVATSSASNVLPRQILQLPKSSSTLVLGSPADSSSRIGQSSAIVLSSPSTSQRNNVIATSHTRPPVEVQANRRAVLLSPESGTPASVNTYRIIHRSAEEPKSVAKLPPPPASPVPTAVVRGCAPVPRSVTSAIPLSATSGIPLSATNAPLSVDTSQIDEASCSPVDLSLSYQSVNPDQQLSQTSPSTAAVSQPGHTSQPPEAFSPVQISQSNSNFLPVVAEKKASVSTATYSFIQANQTAQSTAAFSPVGQTSQAMAAFSPVAIREPSKQSTSPGVPATVLVPAIQDVLPNKSVPSKKAADISASTDLPRKVFLASTEKGGQKLIRLDVRSVQALQNQGKDPPPPPAAVKKVPMARITSSDLNSAPEIQLTDQLFPVSPAQREEEGEEEEVADSLAAAVKQTGQPSQIPPPLTVTPVVTGHGHHQQPVVSLGGDVRPVPKFDGFKFVSQDGRVLEPDAPSSSFQGLQLLSAEGNLIKAEELPVLSESRKQLSLSPAASLPPPPPEQAKFVFSSTTPTTIPTSGGEVAASQPPAPLPTEAFKSPAKLSNLVPISGSGSSPTTTAAVADNKPTTAKQSQRQQQPKEMKGYVTNLTYLGQQTQNSKPAAKSKSRSKGKPRESMKAKMQKLESALNVQHLANLLEKNKENELEEDLLEASFLDTVEEESAGLELTKEKLETCKEYYTCGRFKKRFIDMSSKYTYLVDRTPEEGQQYLASLLRRHVKMKRTKHGLLHGIVEKPETKGKSKGKTKEKLSPIELKNLQRHKLWSIVMKKEVGKGHKARNYNCKEKLANAKRIATACMRAQRQKANSSQKIMKESVWRAKRIAREIQAFWKKSEREEKIQKRAKEKVEQEQRKQDIELLEAKRQQRKLNYLITQTELYAHFMAGKMGRGTGETEETILSRLNSDIQEQRVRDLDYYDEAAVKESARNVAAAAAKRQEAVKLSYDQTLGDIPEDGLRMSEAAETAGDRPQPSLFQGTLKTYQLKGMNWLCSLYEQGINGILADEMGLGKTVQSLSFLAYVAETYGIWGPFLVITPASTLHNWQQELAKFLPDFKTVPYWGSPQERKVLRGFWSSSNLHAREASFHIVITSYQIVVSDFKYFNKHRWQYMVLDEAQAIKSASSQRWKMLLEFKCRGRLLLSGTPIQNTMAELWSLLHFVMPALFDSHEEFKEWFSKDIEGHAEGSRGKVDEKQMSRLHLILKPFMLRRIKKDVEHELTDKVEILVYCPLTIRQKLLYDGLKQNLRIDELLAGLGLGSGSGSAGVSSLMNLVMQFRKVCNHPELFERREARSPLIFSLPSFRIPRLIALDRPTPPAEHPKFSVFRADKVSRQLLEVEDHTFDFLRIVETSPGELESQAVNLYHQWLKIAQQTLRNLSQSYALPPDTNSCAATGKLRNCCGKLMRHNRSRSLLLLDDLQLPSSLVFTSPSSTFLSHCDHIIHCVPETISHRIMRSAKHVALAAPPPPPDDAASGGGPLCPELPHTVRPAQLRRCVATPCPPFLVNAYSPRVGALPRTAETSSRTAEYRRKDHERVWVGPGRAQCAKKLLLGEAERSGSVLHYSPVYQVGMKASRPGHGWSNIQIPDKHSLITDAGKLFVLDGLLSRLKEEGHRVLIYSQMTKMIDLLEEFMSHRHHSYMRLDGSSKIHERRDMVADFQTRQDIFVFLLSTRAGGLGINLTAADTVIFYDSDWNPTVDQQAMDRAHRLGQTKQVTVYRLVCKGTIEERILERAREKSEIHRMVIQGGSFKGKSADLKPKEVVSLLLGDEEIENKMKEKIDLKKVELRESDGGGEKKDAATPKKRKLKEPNNSSGSGGGGEGGKKPKLDKKKKGQQEPPPSSPSSSHLNTKDQEERAAAKQGGKPRGRPKGSSSVPKSSPAAGPKTTSSKAKILKKEPPTAPNGVLADNPFGFYNQT